MMFRILHLLLKNWPSTAIMNKIRGRVYGIFLKGTKKNLRICRDVNIINPQNVTIGDNVVINPESILIASSSGEITIGNDVLIAPRCYVQTQTHNYLDKQILIRKQGANQMNITIGDDVWLAYGVVVLCGVNISQGSVIAAGSIVTKNTEPYSVNAGIPAKIVKYRK